jgi:hypothetical protein
VTSLNGYSSSPAKSWRNVARKVGPSAVTDSDRRLRGRAACDRPGITGISAGPPGGTQAQWPQRVEDSDRDARPELSPGRSTTSTGRSRPETRTSEPESSDCQCLCNLCSN